MNSRKIVLVAALITASGIAAMPATAGNEPAGSSTAAKAADPDKPTFDQAFLTDATNIEAGGEMWKQCRHCHGSKAYPGKAPKLKPGKYTPEFVFKRVTKGFRKMPPWKAVFSTLQRMQIVAYIKSPKFSP